MYYSELIRFAEQEEFNSFVRGTIADDLISEYVQGVQVGIDRYWAEAFLLDRFMRYGPFGSFWQFASNLTSLTRESRLFTPFGSFDYNDLFSDFRPPYWKDYCKSQGYPENANPIFIKFLLRERFEPRRSISPNRWQQHPIRYEYRPPCVGVSVLSAIIKKGQLGVGSGIWSDNTQDIGTAGGYIRDPQNGQIYMVSCSHVVGQIGGEISYPPPGILRKPDKVGNVVHNTTLVPGSLTPYYNPHITPDGPKTDVGFIKLDQSISVDTNIPKHGYVNFPSPITIMGPYQPIVLTGSISGQIRGELGPLCPWVEIIINGITYCFRDFFEITPPRPFYLNTALVKGGDSGAWVIKNISGIINWDGMIVGCDGAHGFGCFAENIINECTSVLRFHPVMA